MRRSLYSIDFSLHSGAKRGRRRQRRPRHGGRRRRRRRRTTGPEGFLGSSNGGRGRWRKKIWCGGALSWMVASWWIGRTRRGHANPIGKGRLSARLGSAPSLIRLSADQLGRLDWFREIRAPPLLQRPLAAPPHLLLPRPVRHGDSGRKQEVRVRNVVRCHVPSLYHVPGTFFVPVVLNHSQVMNPISRSLIH